MNNLDLKRLLDNYPDTADIQIHSYSEGGNKELTDDDIWYDEDDNTINMQY